MSKVQIIKLMVEAKKYGMIKEYKELKSIFHDAENDDDDGDISDSFSHKIFEIEEAVHNLIHEYDLDHVDGRILRKYYAKINDALFTIGRFEAEIETFKISK